MKCENCGNKPATVHLTEIRGGKKIEKHLCEQCASQAEGVPLPKQHTPINELLTSFVKAHAGLPTELGTSCPHCGITWAEFRQSGLLGCEHDYTAFEKDLTPLLQRAHEGQGHHVGKSPMRGKGGAAVEVEKTLADGVIHGEPVEPRKKKVVDVGRLKKELAKAVEAEDYERAAKLRDQIREAEEKPSV